MDLLVTELKAKKAKIEYLSGFTKTATEAIEAMEKDLSDQEKKLKETELESKTIVNSMNLIPSFKSYFRIKIK